MIPSYLRPGYAQIEAVSLLAPDSQKWEPFTRDVLKMPLSMLQAVQYAVKAKGGRHTNDPLEQVRNIAENWEGRRLLFAGTQDRCKGDLIHSIKELRSHLAEVNETIRDF